MKAAAIIQINPNISINDIPSSDKPKTTSYADGLRVKPYNSPENIRPIPRAHPAKGIRQIAVAIIFIPTRKIKDC
jgi:hypothetical protein